MVKFHLFMRADGETTTFESGQDCFFSKSILAAFASTSPEVLAQPIQMATYIKALNTGDNTLMVSLRDSSGNKLACEWTNDDDWEAVTAVAVANIKQALLLS